jgi:hypothetical protein
MNEFFYSMLQFCEFLTIIVIDYSGVRNHRRHFILSYKKYANVNGLLFISDDTHINEIYHIDVVIRTIAIINPSEFLPNPYTIRNLIPPNPIPIESNDIIYNQ